MPLDSNSTKSRIPRRSAGQIVLVVCVSAAILCGAALLPKSARIIVLGLSIPIAAAILPSLFFAAANVRCPACRKSLPLAYEGSDCPACGAPLDLKPPKPSARV